MKEINNITDIIDILGYVERGGLDYGKYVITIKELSLRRKEAYEAIKLYIEKQTP